MAIDKSLISGNTDMLILKLLEKQDNAAKVIGDIVLAIGESSRPAETAHDGAGGTANAGFYFISIDGTATAAEGMSGFEYRDPQGGSPVGQLVSGKDASRASANDNDIVIHSTTSTKKNS